MPSWLLLPMAAGVLILAYHGRHRIPRFEWVAGGLLVLFLSLAAFRPEASLSGLYLALLAAGAMFGGERGIVPYAGSCACAVVAGLTGELSAVGAGGAALVAGFAVVSRIRGLRRAGRKAPGLPTAVEEGSHQGADRGADHHEHGDRTRVGEQGRADGRVQVESQHAEDAGADGRSDDGP